MRVAKRKTYVCEGTLNLGPLGRASGRATIREEDWEEGAEE